MSFQSAPPVMSANGRLRRPCAGARACCLARSWPTCTPDPRGRPAERARARPPSTAVAAPTGQCRRTPRRKRSLRWSGADGDDERHRIFMFRADVNEVDVQPVDLGDELRQGVQPRLAFAPVVLGRPVPRNAPNAPDVGQPSSTSNACGVTTHACISSSPSGNPAIGRSAPHEAVGSPSKTRQARNIVGLACVIILCWHQAGERGEQREIRRHGSGEALGRPSAHPPGSARTTWPLRWCAGARAPGRRRRSPGRRTPAAVGARAAVGAGSALRTRRTPWCGTGSRDHRLPRRA